jgi:DNA-binding MarR family transcriptional regulator
MTASRFRDLIARRGLSFTDCDGALRAIALDVRDYLAESTGSMTSSSQLRSQKNGAYQDRFEPRWCEMQCTHKTLHIFSGLSVDHSNGTSILAAIVQCGNFAGAGKALNMSQSGVSRSIARLEARLRMRLFERTTRSVSMTDEGRRLYEQIGPLLMGLKDAVASLMEGRALMRDRLRVQIHRTFAHFLEGVRLSAFLEAHPELDLELITRDQLGDLPRISLHFEEVTNNLPLNYIARPRWSIKPVSSGMQVHVGQPRTNS